MIIIVSNRNVNEGATDHTVFGEQTNTGGINELRVATASYDANTSQWNVNLLPETEEIMACNISINLLIHSLGNYLVESFIRSPVFTGETRIFDNIIFHQADVDNRKHTEWIDRVEHGQRIYVTINEFDLILKKSDIINPARLGNTVEGVTAALPLYIDFTGGEHVRGNHNFFQPKSENLTIAEFFQQVLTGKHGERVSGFEFDSRTNTFRLAENE